MIRVMLKLRMPELAKMDPKQALPLELLELLRDTLEEVD